jgi:Zn-dependent protease
MNGGDEAHDRPDDAMSPFHPQSTWLDNHPALARAFRQLHRLLFPPPTRFDVRFHVFGFPVRGHPACWLPHIVFAAAVATVDLLRGDPWWPLAFVLCLACTFGALLAHELGHAIAARKVGLCYEVVLTFFGGFVRRMHADPAWYLGYRPSRRQRVLIFLSGPAVNLVVAFAALAVWALMGSAEAIYREIVSNPHGVPPSLIGCLLPELLVLVLAGANLAAGVGNLVPIPPLDGGWIALEVIGWVRTRGRPSRDVDEEWWFRM